MKGRWRKDKRPCAGGGYSPAFAVSSSRHLRAREDQTFWGRPHTSLHETSGGASVAENSSINRREERDSLSSSECNSNSGDMPTSSSNAQNSCANNNDNGMDGNKNDRTEASPSGSGSSRNIHGSCISSSKSAPPAASSLFEEDSSYFSRRRLRVAGGESRTATAQLRHLKNAAYAAAQSLRQSQQLLCDGSARLALKQALEGGSIYLPAFCCSHADFSIFEALMRDLLLYALQQQQQQQKTLQERWQWQQSSSDDGDEKKKRSSHKGTSLGRLKSDDGETLSSFLGAVLSPCTSTACTAAAESPTPRLPVCASDAGSDAHPCGRDMKVARAESYWRELLRPSTPSEQRAFTFSAASAGAAAEAGLMVDAATVAAASTTAAASSVIAAATAAAPNPLESAAAVGAGVVNWSCHLKHENPSFSRTFQAIVEQLSTYFNVVVYASRLNMYMDGTHWKPLHHDSHAYSSQEQQREDFTVGASFGATRALEFVHVRSAPYNSSRSHDEQQPAAAVRFLFPQRNGDIFAFNADVNRRFKHGVPPIPATTRLAGAKPATAAKCTDGEKKVITANLTAEATKSAAAPTQQAAGHQSGSATTGDKDPLNGECTCDLSTKALARATPEKEPEASESSFCTAAAAASGVCDNRSDTQASLEEIATAGAAAAARAAAAATDGNGPRFSIIVWGRRRQLSERNASLRELAAVSQNS